MQSKACDYDVIIVGGGLSGLSLACLLGDTVPGLRVACLDRDTPQDQLRTDIRTTAISYGSSQILDRADVWGEIVAQGCPIEHIDILDGVDSPLFLQFLSQEVDSEPFGWIISNHHIRTCLMNKIASLPQVDHITPACVRTFHMHDAHVDVILEDERCFSAALVVGADGRQSAVRDFMDVEVRTTDYKQTAVICFVSHENAHHNRAVEHFLADGPFAILPMPPRDGYPNCSSLVFTEHRARRGGSLMDLDDSAFLARVKAYFPLEYGEIDIIDNKRMAYPLSLSHATDYIAPRMVLVADAAHGIHPIAGQGLNLGFRDLDVLTRLIAQAHILDDDIGATALLQDYQRKRRPDNMAMIAFTDGMVRLFSNDILPVRAVRRLGLRAVAHLPFAKQFFMRRAMGK